MPSHYVRTKKEKPLMASLIFPEIARQLEIDPKAAGNLRGFFIVTVKKKGWLREEWYLLFQGFDAPPSITRERPDLPSTPTTPDAEAIPVVLIEIEDSDILNFVTGGLTGWRGIATGRIKIAGDLLLAQSLEDVFRRAGGVERVMAWLDDVKNGRKKQYLRKEKAKI